MPQAGILEEGGSFLDLFFFFPTLGNAILEKGGGYQQQESDQGADVPFQILPSSKEPDFLLSL